MMKITDSFNCYEKVMAILLLSMLFSACTTPPSKEGIKPEQSSLSPREQYRRHLLEKYGESMPLEDAIVGDFTSCVQAAVKKQGTANFVVDDDMGWTVLHYACLHGSPETVQLLLSLGADPGIRDAQGELPVSLAWGAIHSQSAHHADSEAEEINRYKKILKMLSVPDQSFEPRSLAAEESAALEVFIQFLPSQYQSYLKINGRAVSSGTLEILREYGFNVVPGSVDEEKDKMKEVNVSLEWISDSEAEVSAFGQWSALDGTITYAFGHWILDIHGWDDIF